jgi:acetylornithine deacetylase/succinyl-diaminopimelate desuccinylase-like protein
MLCGAAMAQAQQQTLAVADQPLAREIFKQLIETNTTESAGSTTTAAEAMRARLLAAGFAASDMALVGPSEKRMNLVVRYRAGNPTAEKPVLILCHLDVVEALATDWTLDPFTFTEKDGYFYGRGTQDMKDNDAAMVTSFILLKKAGYVPKRDIILALTAGEETGLSNGVDWLLKNRPELVDGEFVVNPDGGGVGLRGGKAYQLGMAASEKVYADFELTATNRGGHSSLPRADNAIYELVDALERLQHYAFPAELNAVTRAYLEQEKGLMTPERQKLAEGVLATPMDPAAVATLTKEPGFNAMLRTTCVATMLKAGHALNALPGEADAFVNCRILPGHSPEEVREELVRVVADPGIKVGYKAAGGRFEETAPGAKTIPPPPLRADVMGPLRAVAQSMWPGIEILPRMTSGASDSKYTMAAGIPSYGIGGMGIEDGDSRAHGRDERIRVDAYYQGVEFARRLVKALGDE